MSIVICPSCGSQFMDKFRGKGPAQLTCPKCGFPIPKMSIDTLVKKGPAPAAKGAARPEKAEIPTEFRDQPSPFTSSRPSERPPSPPKPIPFAAPTQPPAQKPSKSAPRAETKPVPQRQKPVPIPMAGIGKPTAGAPMQRASSKQEKLVSLNSLVGGSKQPASPPKSAPRPLPGKEMSRPSIPSPSEINDQDSEAPGQPVVLATKPSAQRLSKPAASQKGTPMASTPQGDVPARKGPAVGGPAQGGHVKGDSIERAMKSELHAVQDKFGPTPRKAAAKKAPAPGQEKILSKEPDSMDDILRDLVRVDQYIKASALVKRDGTLLASEISSNLSDSLVSIIATTVTTIAKDVIFATESGELKHIMFSGTTGIVYVVPVVNDIFLVLQTSNVSKKGIIEVVAKQVEKRVKAYLNLN